RPDGHRGGDDEPRPGDRRRHGAGAPGRRARRAGLGGAALRGRLALDVGSRGLPLVPDDAAVPPATARRLGRCVRPNRHRPPGTGSNSVTCGGFLKTWAPSAQVNAPVDGSLEGGCDSTRPPGLEIQEPMGPTMTRAKRLRFACAACGLLLSWPSASATAQPAKPTEPVIGGEVAIEYPLA